MKINIKPLSTNQLWQGRRFKTPLYKSYEQEMMYLLPKLVVPNSKLLLKIKFGLSSKLADLDNCCKGCVDILARKYDFNDRMIYKIEAEKVITKKGREFIEFEITEI